MVQLRMKKLRKFTVKLTLYWAVGVLLMNDSAVAHGDNHVLLTLDESIEWALAESDSVISARLRSLVAQADTDIARSRYDTRFQAFAQYEDAGLPMRGNPLIQGSESTVAEAGLFRTLPRGTDIGLQTDVGRFRYDSEPGFPLPPELIMATTRLSITQPLWRNAWGALDRAQNRAAQARFTASELNFDDAREAIAGLVHSLFWQVYMAEANAEANARSLDWASRLAEISEQRYADRLIDKSDLLSAQAAVAIRQAESLQDRLQVDQIRLQLFEVIGWPVERWKYTQFVYPDSVSESLLAEEDLDVQTVFAEALSQRSDYQALNYEREAWLKDAEIARQAGRPGVDLQATYGVGADGPASRDAWGADETAWSVGVSVDVAIGQRAERARREQARLNQELVEVRQQQMARQIYRELAESRRGYEAALAKREATGRAVALYQRRLALEEERLAQGRSTTEQVIRFRDELERAEHQYIVTRADLEMAQAAFALARGVLLAEREIRR